MKERSHVNSNLSLVLAVLLLLMVWSNGCDQFTAQEPAQQATTAETLVFEGVLEKLGPDPGVTNGRFAAYRLAKYRVERLCKGEYDQSEIVIDHSIFTGKEFEGIKVNDRVCVTVKRSKKIQARNNADGIRSPSDVVTTFYISESPITQPTVGCCDNQ